MGLSINQALGMSEDIRSHSESYMLDTEIMLGFAISKTKEYLRAHGEHILTELQEQQFQHMLLRRKLGEPIAYIVGKRGFWDFELVVNDHVLIPRPETEILVEFALETLGSSKNKLRIADLGTGSGAVAIAIARTNPRWRVHAVDICPKALGVARHNARNLEASNIKFHKGSWCKGLPDETFDLIVANPPYLMHGDKHLVEDGLQFEPTIALTARDSGYSDLKHIIRQSREYLKKGSWLLLEHGYNQQDSIIECLKRSGYFEVSGRKDYSGINRVVAARWEGK